MAAADLDESLRDSVTGLVSALGGIDPNEPDHPYVLGDDALGCLKDLKKWVKFYGSSGKLNALRCIADTNLVSLDICHMLAKFKEGQEHDKIKWRLALNCLELLVQLTWQIELDPTCADPLQYAYETPLKYAQIDYKNAILKHPQHNVLRPIIRIGLPSMAIPRRERSDRDDSIITLVVSLLRNLVEISARTTESAGMDRLKNDHSRSDTILAFDRNDVFTLLIALAAGTVDEYEKIDCLLFEIVYHLVKGVRVDDLLAATGGSKPPLGDLSNMLRKEENIKRYNKRFTSTRHSRFGTMISIVGGNDLRLTVPGQTTFLKSQSQALTQLDSAKKFAKPYRAVAINDLDKPVQLTNEAGFVLCRFVTSFLESSFNSTNFMVLLMMVALLTSVVRAIECESSRCCDAHRYQLLYVIAWCLKVHRLQHDARSKSSEDIDHSNVASAFDPRCLVLVLRIMRDASDHKNWTELHAAMECFEELLNTVETMRTSKSSEENDIANNVLLNLFYDEANLELIVHNVKNYKRQSFGYLDACTSLAHTLLNLLEHFSKDRRLYVKSKRQSKSRRKNHNSEADNESEEDERSVATKVAEKSFQFSAFELKFANERCVNTFRSLLDLYVELRPDQIKRVLVYFHRIFEKRKQQVILYRLDICELLFRMVNDEKHIPRGTSIRRHLEDFVTHYTHSLTKALANRPILCVELLFSKLSGTIYYLQHGKDEIKSQPRRPRAAAELEVRPGRDKEDQIGVVVAALLDDQKSQELDSIKAIVAKAITEIRAWEEAADAKRLAAASYSPTREDNPVDTPRPPIDLSFGDEAFRKIIFKDGKLQLLLRLMEAERIGEKEARWTIPVTVRADDLDANCQFLKQYIDEPPSFENGRSAEDFLRRQAVPKPSYDEIDPTVSDSNQSTSSDEPTNRKKRKRKRVDDALLEARREKRRLADLKKRALIQSAARIVDSDDDEEEDRRFFEQERKLRERMAARALEGVFTDRPRKSRAEKPPWTQLDVGIEESGVVQKDTILGSGAQWDPVLVLEKGSEESDSDSVADVKPHKRRNVRRALSISSSDE